MDGSKVVWPGAPSPFASGAREHACSLQRVTVSWGRRPGETRLAGYGLHEPAAIRTASIVYRTRRTVQTRRKIPFARGSGRMPTHNECTGARRLKSQVAGRGGVEQALDGPPVRDPSPVPVFLQQSACHPSTTHLPCSMWALGS